MFGNKKQEADVTAVDSGSDHNDPLANTGKSQWQRIWPVLVCGGGLFSDGYINNVIGSVSTILSRIYGDQYTKSSALQNVSSIAFAGTVVGQLIFGYTSDKWSRKNSLLVSTVLLALFAGLAASSYGYKGSTSGMFQALVAWRFLVGIGIGGEYPAGSVAASEATGELKSGRRHRWFILATNCAIDVGFVTGAFVPYLVVVATTEKHLRAAWRIMLGLGVVCPIILLFARTKLKEPEEFKKESMKYVKIPYKHVIAFYWPRLLVVSAIWFMYDFSTYSFGIYSSSILANIFDSTTSPLSTALGWNVIINLFYLPGAIFGSFLSDWVGPKYALTIGVELQAIFGFIMASAYNTFAEPKNVGAFVVIYGLFLSLGEVGPGDNIGLLASKTCATGVRGQYYGIAASVGKIGAFVGTWVFPELEKINGGSAAAKLQYPFYLSSAMCVFTGLIAFFFLPNVGQDTITTEDIRFRAYLESRGWDTNQLGMIKGESIESRAVIHQDNRDNASDEKL
ncbi:MFS phospholipid transporter-like protein Git1 [Calycina marina]|uniref:MFS phospholipid transporter-like protein Git1 n=1 Tax=Calycina marina TaxID=1763456 RepID=A0A9P7Z626_9HELO|nr:MFS phospholipid transporter-like protein Git1 [Calycina marina]